MSEGRECSEWNRTASTMALMINLTRTSDSDRAYEPADFHPYLKTQDEIINPKDLCRGQDDGR